MAECPQSPEVLHNDHHSAHTWGWVACLGQGRLVATCEAVEHAMLRYGAEDEVQALCQELNHGERGWGCSYRQGRIPAHLHEKPACCARR